MSPSIDMSVKSNGQTDGYTNGHINGRVDGANGHAKPISTHVHDKFDIAGKVYIVTGGGRGLGLGMAEALIEAGAYVYCFDCLPKPHPDFTAVQKRSMSKADQTSRLQYRRVDVRETEEVDFMISSIASSHSRLDGLIAAAAIQQPTPAIECTSRDISHMMSINYTGVFLTATAVARAMIEHITPGSILFVASMSGMVANKGLTSPVYNSTKAALIQLAKNMAMEWGPHGIRVNSLCPGHILTPMVQEHLDEEPELERFWSGENMMGRLARVDEFKGAAIFMLSEASSFMTGSSIVIDGGHTAW